MAQLHNKYSIDGPDKLWGRPAVVVRVVPLNPDEAHWLYGRAWLNPEDGSVFKIEWEEKSIGNYEEALAHGQEAERPAGHLFCYGIRIREERDTLSQPVQDRRGLPTGRSGSVRRLRKSELEVRCRDYKFFTVETEIKGMD